MLTITDLQGQAEPVTDYKGLEINEEINGDFSLTCVFLNSDKNKYVYPLIAEESIVEYEGNEYRIKNIVKETLRKTVSAQHIYFDLIDHRIYGITGGTLSPDDAFLFALAGSGWTFEIVDDISPQLIFNFGDDNAVSLIKKAREAFNCEVKICPGKHLKIYKQIGKDDDYQFRYRHNIKAIKETVDTTKLATIICGYGGNGLEVTYTSPNSVVFGERHAEPVRDERYTIADSLLERIKGELVDTPEVSIELEAIMLEDAGLGDKVWLIHERLGIEFQTRIMAQKKRPQTPMRSTVTLGNRKQTLSDMLTETKVEIIENQKETRSKIEQTNERIGLEVEAVNESIATVNLKADNIILSVEDLEDSVAAIDLKADNIVLSVSTLGGRMDSAEASISVQAGQISQKVSANGVIAAFNMSPEVIALQANKIDLLGITNVSSNLYIGSYSNVSRKEIKFNGMNAIYDNGTTLGISGQYVHFDTAGVTFARNSNVYFSESNVDFSGATVTGLYAKFG